MAYMPRPLSFGELLDSAFTLYRRNFSVLFGTALLPQLPVLLFWIIAPVLAGASASDETLATAAVLIMPYTLFAYVLMMGAGTHAAAQAYTGGRPTVGDSLRAGLKRWFTLFGATVIAWFLIMGGFILFIIPGIIVFAMFFGYAPAAVVEGLGATAALGRSRALSKGARGRILLTLFVAWVIVALPSIAMWMVAGVTAATRGGAEGAAAAFATGGTMYSAIQASSVLLSAITWPFLLIVALLLYYDRRARTEAPDLEQAAASLQHDLV